MSEQTPNTVVPRDPVLDPLAEPPRKTMHDMLGDMSFVEWVRDVRSGLKMPKDSGEHKYAIQQILRLWSPVVGIGLPGLMIIVLLLMPQTASVVSDAFQVKMMETTAAPKLDDVKPVEEEPPVEPPPPIEDVQFDKMVVADNNVAMPGPPGPAGPGGPGSDTQFSPAPAGFDAVAMVKSPIVMKGIYGARSTGMRGAALKEYGGKIGGSGITEGAVLRALRWLKKYQSPNGSWTSDPGGKAPPAQKGESRGPYPTSMTGLALLTFLAHGETPTSEDFGPTVQKAIQYLVSVQAPNGYWESSYTHAICTYAMCEAYALTRIPMVKTAAEKGIAVVVRGQNASGGWNYPIQPCDRDDTSVMGWCAQGLKAAKMGKLKPEGLEKAWEQAIKGFQKNASPGGGFGYATEKGASGPGATGLSGVGVLCMQLLGASKKPECKKGLEYLRDKFPFVWNDALKWQNVYYWYYITQARFHAGGDMWDTWNNQFAPQLVKNQIIERGAGDNGKDIGYWVCPAGTIGPTMDTTLCALQLQVYYRYLPTYKTPTETDADTDIASGADEVDVEIKTN